MEELFILLDFFRHIDQHLNALFLQYGAWTYSILFIVIFCETGLVVTPILPGDSLLFAAGALAAGGGLDVHLLWLLLFVAAVFGDALNYHIGAYIGPRAFEGKRRFLKREYLERTQRFYERYGGKTIIIARFVPIVRTFAPFLAGVGRMGYLRFFTYNVFGGLLWTLAFIYGGYFFGAQPFVKKNFEFVVLAIIIISVMPAVYEYMRAWREVRKNAQVLAEKS